MKKLIAALVALLLIATGIAAIASSPGSPENPLITKSFLGGEFRDSLLEDINSRLDSLASAELARLDELYRALAGYMFAPGFTQVTLPAGSTINLTTGSSFILQSGSAVITIHSGAVINVSSGANVNSGTVLLQNNRYFCVENTSATITASTAVIGMVDGFFLPGERVDLAALPAESLNPFIDVSSADWFYNAVSHVYNAELMRGTSTTPMLFSPQLSLTRAMFVTTIHRLDGEPPHVGASIFTDVQNPQTFYHNAVIWANASGIVFGMGEGIFGPHENVTREQMATFLYRYAIYKELNTSVIGRAFEAFPDSAQVSDFAQNAVRWAVDNEIIRGADGRLLPQNTATRAEVAQILMNFSRWLGE